MKIISLRGTNGAGKSTIVRAIMKLYDQKRENMVMWRRKPLSYVLGKLRSEDGAIVMREELFIPGHYEIANGGVDTLADLDSAYDLIREAYEQKYNVLYEGKNMSDSVNRLAEFPKTDVAVIVVDHPVDECIASVRARGHSIKEETIRRLHTKVNNDALKFIELGFQVHRLNREQALAHVRELLHV